MAASVSVLVYFNPSALRVAARAWVRDPGRLLPAFRAEACLGGPRDCHNRLPRLPQTSAARAGQPPAPGPLVRGPGQGRQAQPAGPVSFARRMPARGSRAAGAAVAEADVADIDAAAPSAPNIIAAAVAGASGNV